MDSSDKQVSSAMLVLFCIMIWFCGMMIGNQIGPQKIKEIVGPTKTYRVEGLVRYEPGGIPGLWAKFIDPKTKLETDKLFMSLLFKSPRIYRDGKDYVEYSENNLWTNKVEIHTN